MGTNFNELWNDPEFIDETQKAKIDSEAALIGKLIETGESKEEPGPVSNSKNS